MNTATMKTLPPPPPAAKTNGKAPEPVMQREFRVRTGRRGGAWRAMLYGPGAIGKSTLAGLAPNPIFLDIEEGTRFMDVPSVDGLSSFADVRACLQSTALVGYDTIVIDSATKLEELAVAHTLATVRNEKGNTVQSVEGYGYGKGYQHVYDTFLLFLADCDAHVRAGRNVILIAHDCTADVPNPVGDDYIRYEPRLQSPKSGKASIRNRVVEWADYVFSIGYDVISEDGKGKGAGTRTIFTTERPDRIAKSRTTVDSIPFTSATDNKIWTLIQEGGK